MDEAQVLLRTLWVFQTTTVEDRPRNHLRVLVGTRPRQLWVKPLQRSRRRFARYVSLFSLTTFLLAFVVLSVLGVMGTILMPRVQAYIAD